MFTFPTLRGNRENPLGEPYSMVISESVAQKYFGAEDPVGKTITADRKYSFTVNAVMQDVPKNSTLRPDIAVPFSFAKEIRRYNPNWNFSSSLTYVRLAHAADRNALKDKIDKLVFSHTKNPNTEFLLFPMAKIHLYNSAGQTTGLRRIHYVYIFISVAVIILALACINYINLTTARSLGRMRNILVKLDPAATGMTIKSLEHTWKSLDPRYPFEFRFLREEIDRMYQYENRMEKLLQYVTF